MWRKLKIFYPNLIHVTCMTHALNLVCEKIRNSYKNINGLIANVKKSVSESSSESTSVQRSFARSATTSSTSSHSLGHMA